MKSKPGLVLGAVVIASMAILLAIRLASSSDDGHGPADQSLTHDSTVQKQTTPALASVPVERTRTPVIEPPALVETPRPGAPSDEGAKLREEMEELTRQLKEARTDFSHREDNYKHEIYLLREHLAKADPQGWLAAFNHAAESEKLDPDSQAQVRGILEMFPVILTPGEATLLAKFQPQGNYTRELVDLLGGPARILHDLSPADIARLRSRNGDEFVETYLGLKPKD